MTTHPETPEQIRAAVTSKFAQREGELSAALEAATDTFVLADAREVPLVLDGGCWRFGFGEGEATTFVRRAEAALVAAQRNRGIPQYPVRVLSHREFLTSRLALVRSILADLAGPADRS